MALVVMIPFDTVSRIIDRAETHALPDPEADILAALKKQKTPIISGHSPIALQPVEWIELISWCRMVSLHDDADLIAGAVAIARALDE
jgi:lysophospholipid acyltransferase (LPLAT)-like uncharacterized protein